MTYAYVLRPNCHIINRINTGNLLGATQKDSRDEKVKLTFHDFAMCIRGYMR